MASSVEIHRAAHDAFNERDWERMRSLMAETIAYGDRPRGLELGSLDEFLGWLREWATGMSDARVSEPDYLEWVGKVLTPDAAPVLEAAVLRDPAGAGREGRQRRDLLRPADDAHPARPRRGTCPRLEGPLAGAGRPRPRWARLEQAAATPSLPLPCE